MRLTRQATAALIAAGIFLFSYATWYFSAEVEVYVLALVWRLLALALMIELVTHPRPRTAPLLGHRTWHGGVVPSDQWLAGAVTVLAVALAPLVMATQTCRAQHLRRRFRRRSSRLAI